MIDKQNERIMKALVRTSHSLRKIAKAEKGSVRDELSANVTKCNKSAITLVSQNAFSPEPSMTQAEPELIKPNGWDIPWNSDERELVYRIGMQTTNDAKKLVLWDRELKRRFKKDKTKLKAELASLRQALKDDEAIMKGKDSGYQRELTEKDKIIESAICLLDEDMPDTAKALLQELLNSSKEKEQ